MSAPYKKVLLVGATSGIGWALAEKYAETGCHVVAVGRRERRLNELASKHNGMVSTKVFDVSKLDKIPKFVEEVIIEHPDLDCVFLNRHGMQRGFNFTKPETVDVEQIDLEVTTNYLSYIHLTKWFLPFLLKKKSTIMYTTSGLGIIPLPRCPNYNATKAALRQFILSIRRQLQDTSVKVVELLPPAVQSELHDAEHQPDIQNGRSVGITIEEFMATAWPGIVEGKEEIAVGFVVMALEKVDGPRKQMMAHMPWNPQDFDKVKQ